MNGFKPPDQKSFFPSTTPTYIPSSEQIFNANNKVNPEPSAAESAETESGEGGIFKPTYLLGVARRKSLVLGVCAVLASLFMGYKTSKQVSQYEGNFRILVEPVSEQQNLDRLTDKTVDSTEELDYFTLIEVLYSPKLLEPILAEAALQYPDISYSSIVSSLVIYRLGETKIIEVTYADLNGEKVKLILNKVAQGYLEYSIQEQQAQLQLGLSFIEEQLPQVRAQVDQLQQELQALQQTYGFIEPDQYAEQLSSRIADLSQQQGQQAVELDTLQMQYAQIQQEAGALETLSDAAKYQELLGEFQLLERQIALESARFGPQHPSIQLLLRQQDNLLPLMLKESEQALGEQLASIANSIQVLQTRYNATGVAIQDLDTRYRELPAVSRRFKELQRELEVATANLTRFLETQEVLKIEASQKEIPWQLISEPGEPWRQPVDNPLKAMATGAIGGMVMGVAIAILLEKLEKTYHTVEAVQQQPLTLLGVIPHFPDLSLSGTEGHVVDLRDELGEYGRSLANSADSLKTELKQLLGNPSSSAGSLIDKLERVSLQRRSSPQHEAHMQAALTPNVGKDWLEEYDAYGFMESFRALYLNINRQGLLDSLNSLVISSALPQSGRTTVAIHLAQAAAAMGRQVLIVDAHLRRGSHRVNDLLGLDNSQGLSEYLQGQATLLETIQRLDWEKSLFAIPAGTSPPDPTRLLSSEIMYELALQLRKTFDLVIYDMPPLMGLADVGLISAKVDGVLLVTRMGQRGSAPALEKAIERLEVVQANVVGLIANQARRYKVDLYA